MKIQQITLKDFKRFTDLTIANLPATARLVVLVGPNGCGKSSLFDAMNFYAKKHFLVMSNTIEAAEYFSKGFVSNDPASSIPDLQIKFLSSFMAG